MKIKTIPYHFLFYTLVILVSSCGEERDTTANLNLKPNILLITATELGYSDLGCFGSEIATPNIDQLAAEGQILAGLRTAPDPVQSTKMLLSGTYNTVNDLPAFTKILADSNYYNVQVNAGIEGLQLSNFKETAKIETERFVPQQISDKLIELLNQKPVNQPFFAWAAFPLSGNIKMDAQTFGKNRYSEITAAGLQKKRFQALLDKGIIDPFTKLSDQNEFVEEKMMDKPRMEAHAQQIEAWDKEVGRLIAFLKEKNQLANTTIYILAQSGISNSQSNPNRLSINWQNAVAAHLGVGLTMEGSLASPLIISGKNIKKSKKSPFATITLPDVTETILATAKLPKLDTIGSELARLMAGKAEQVHKNSEYILVEKDGHIALRQAEWKLVSFGKTADKKDFKLYNLLGDPGERNDLSSAYPARKKRMMEYYKKTTGNGR